MRTWARRHFMRIISRRAMREFVRVHTLAEVALDTWYKIAKRADWDSLVAVKKVYPHADLFGECTVFNIHGHSYRLIAHIVYRYRTIYIRDILTHKEYDKGRWKRGCRSI
jgi:mRNA interferase HigB